MEVFIERLGDNDAQIFVPTADDFDASVFRCVFPPNVTYGLDVEGTYMTDLAQWDPDFRVRKIQFATPGYAWVLTLNDPGMYDAAVALLRDETVTFVSHTSMDVLSVATRMGADISARNVDTRMLAAMVDPDMDRGRDLKTLTTLHLGPQLEAAEAVLHDAFIAMWPGKKNAKRSEIDAYGWAHTPDRDPDYNRYAGLDAVAAIRLAPILTGLTRAPADLLRAERWLATEAVRIQERGMRVDRAALDALHSEAVAETSAADEIIGKIATYLDPKGVSKPIKARSPKLWHWLGDHGVDWVYWKGALTDTGTPSLSKDNVKLLYDFPLDGQARPVVDALVRFKAHQDSLNKTKGILEHLAPDGRVHPSLNTLAAVTARMSSSGVNFQNFNKKDPRHRGLWLPDEGMTFVTIDFDQIELRVVAALAHEQKMIETILGGGDLHQLTVDELAAAGVVITRDAAKIVNFLIVYGGGPKALNEQTGIPLDESAKIISTWRERYPAITEYAAAMGEFTRDIRTVSYRRIPVTVNKKTGQPRSYANINYAVQSSARDLLVGAWRRLDELSGLGDRVWYPIHDELVLQCRPDEVAHVVSEAERHMRFDFWGVPISATAVELIDRDGVSRWMTSKNAEKIKAERLAVA